MLLFIFIFWWNQLPICPSEHKHSLAQFICNRGRAGASTKIFCPRHKKFLCRGYSSYAVALKIGPRMKNFLCRGLSNELRYSGIVLLHCLLENSWYEEHIAWYSPSFVRSKLTRMSE